MEQKQKDSAGGAERASEGRAAEIVVFGEVLFDVFPDGRRAMGGAPFNVAWGLKGFGRDPALASAVGSDADGEMARVRMEAWGMRTDGLQEDRGHATGEVRVELAGGEARYEIMGPRAWDNVGDAGWRAEKALYHGLLALRSENNRRTLGGIRERSAGAIRFFDVNLRPPHDSAELLEEWMAGAEWLKLNVDELGALPGGGKTVFGRHERALGRLMERYGIRNVLLTAGAGGLAIQGEYGEAACAPAPRPERLEDTVGAGDSVSAVAIDGILRGTGAREIVERAGLFAARVWGLRGATTGEKEFYRHER